MRSTFTDRMVQRPLTKNELWSSWPISKIDGIHRVIDKTLDRTLSTTIPRIYPPIRIDHSLSSNCQLKSRMDVRRLKLQIIRDALNGCNDISSDDTSMDFEEAWDLMRSLPWSASLSSLDNRLEEAMGKNATGIKAERSMDLSKALYHFALGWVYLIPYHVDALEASSKERRELAKVEKLLFTNIAICAKRLAAEPALDTSSKYNLWRLSYCSTLISLTLYFAMTAQEVYDNLQSIYEVSRDFKEIPNTPYDYVTGRTEFLIRTMEDYLLGKPKDLQLRYMDHKIPLNDRRLMETLEWHRLEG
ncbi:uncharacterized protein L199_006838 [Kwoniella botswanensis]|uniref:uncharacterized protein n=1 Tax=Kwoniella botswanensis TaxID=1268659 RepID=UPI00315DAEA2